MKRALKWIGIGLLGLLLLTLVLSLGGGALLYQNLKSSLADLDGELELSGLDAPVRIERDALGIPTLHGENRSDLAFATGFLHGQERFFQMDLLRRKGAGELAEWFGEAALGLDSGARLHRFRHRARLAVEHSTPEGRELLSRYAAGVNAGVEALGARPPEYWAPGIDLRPWLVEDSYVVLYAMYLELQSGQWRREAWRDTMHECLPELLVRFLLPTGTEWDAPLFGDPPEPAPLPGPEVIDLRTGEASSLPDAARLSPVEIHVELPGSNGWAVAGSRTTDGRALLANDMHLPLGMPNIWYRISMVLPDGTRMTGHSLPGTPFLIGGSNGRIAWGYTNGYVDTADRVPLEWVDSKRRRYRTPGGPRALEMIEETIVVRGREPISITVQESIWGPRITAKPDGPGFALRWVAHLEGAANGGLLELERARTVAEAIALAPQVGIPVQNLMVADHTGSIGWTLIGRLPRRVGFDGSRAVSWADGSARWEGWLDAGEVPATIDPEEGLIWSANNRVVDLDDLPRVGNGGYDLGARARQIRDGLRKRPVADEAAMLQIQLDDRALLLERWRDRLLMLLDNEALIADPRRRKLRELVEQDWDGHASVDRTGFRLVRGFRSFAARLLLEPLVAPCLESDPTFRYFALTHQWERPLWALMTLQPPHLLDPAHASWDDALLAAVDALLDGYLDEEGAQLADRTWGELNTVQIVHPFSRPVPRLSPWLDPRDRPLPGASDMPRVQSTTFGASQRMVVAPGHEEDGLYHMPGGQSGHPLSPHYLAGHEDWVQGYPSPLLPGPPEHELLLRPGG